MKTNKLKAFSAFFATVATSALLVFGPLALEKYPHTISDNEVLPSVVSNLLDKTILSQNSFDIKSQIKEDMAFVKNYKNSSTTDLTVNLNSDIQFNTKLEKLAREFMLSFGHFFWSNEDTEKIKSFNINRFNEIDGNTFFYDPNYKFISFGENALEKINNNQKVFDSKQEFMSYVFFHELAHHIFIKEKLNHNLNDFIENMEYKKGLKFSDDDVKEINVQANEAFADAFSMIMLSKRYPNMDIEKTKNLLAGMRISNSNFSHQTAPALIELKTNQLDSFDDILKTSLLAMKTNIAFYQNITTENNYTNEQLEARTSSVNLGVNVNFSEIKNNMANLRSKYIEISQKNDGIAPK